MGEKITSQRRAIGKRLADARDALHLKQSDIASRCDVNERTVSRWERGASLPPSKSERRAVEDAYGLPPGALDDTAAHRVMKLPTAATIGRLVFGANVRDQRIRVGLSASDLARAIGFHEGKSIEELEAGKSSAKLREEKLPKLARALDVKPAVLLRERPLVPYRADPSARVSADLLWEIASDLRRFAERLDRHGKDFLQNAIPEEHGK